jgi:hypothetical protein
MTPSGECLRRIAPAAARIVDGFIETTQNTNKTQLLPRYWSIPKNTKT